MVRKQLLRKIILSLFVFFQFSYLYLVKLPHLTPLDTASLTSASATLSNSRLSYRAGVASGTINTSTVTIDASGNGDNDTNHLFPNDATCFTDTGTNGCIGSTTYTVANTVDGTTFNITNILGANLDTGGYAIASQAGSLTISFVTASVIPSNGDILITIPAVNTTGKTNDGIPDTSSAVGTNGFDLNGIAAADISTTGCTDGNWVTTETITPGTASSDHTIRIDRQTSSCAAGTTITVTIDNSPGIVNPAPLTSGHTQGTADVYTITTTTRDGSDNTLDTVDMKVAPVEGVFVSATVDESLSFAVAGISASTSTCGQTTDVTTTAMSVPWGTLSTANSFSEASQQLTVSTNADGGYSVKVEENDQMGKGGGACSGAAAGEASNCIKDTTCNGGACTESTSAEWTTATNNGLGFSLANVSGTDATFLYNESARTFSSRQVADQEASETKQNVMYNAGQVSGSSAYVCYRISVSGTQPAGYYFNKVKYTATAIF